jgi:hypothetical protein
LGFLPWFQGVCWFTQGVLVYSNYIFYYSINGSKNYPREVKGKKKQKNFRFVTMNFEVVISFCEFFALLELPIKRNAKGKSGLYYVVT